MGEQRLADAPGAAPGKRRSRLLVLAFVIVALVALGYGALILGEMRFAP